MPFSSPSPFHHFWLCFVLILFELVIPKVSSFSLSSNSIDSQIFKYCCTLTFVLSCSEPRFYIFHSLKLMIFFCFSLRCVCVCVRSLTRFVCVCFYRRIQAFKNKLFVCEAHIQMIVWPICEANYSLWQTLKIKIHECLSTKQRRNIDIERSSNVPRWYFSAIYSPPYATHTAKWNRQVYLS